MIVKLKPAQEFLWGEPRTTMAGVLCVARPGLSIEILSVAKLKTQAVLAPVVGEGILLLSVMETWCKVSAV